MTGWGTYFAAQRADIKHREMRERLQEKIAEQDAARGRPLTDAERLANLRRNLDQPERCVYFRRKDGRGSVMWGTCYDSDNEAIAARDACYQEVTDATMVWATRSDWSGALGDVLTREL